MKEHRRESIARSELILLVLFFLSGVSALIYQVIWQKLLFTAFGVDLLSVTIIVSAMMLGLGIGALIGGEVSDRYPDSQITFFIWFEIGIGLFGLISYDLINFLGSNFIHGSLLTIAVINFLTLLFPTTIMGATLPVLVTYLHRHSHNIGISIGKLYFSNTTGAAAGCLLAGFILLIFMKYSQTLYIAATINFTVAALTYRHVYIRTK